MFFTDGAEQWCKKVGLDAPCFQEIKRAYYTALCRGHKLFEKSYNDYMSALMESLEENLLRRIVLCQNQTIQIQN